MLKPYMLLIGEATAQVPGKHSLLSGQIRNLRFCFSILEVFSEPASIFMIFDFDFRSLKRILFQVIRFFFCPRRIKPHCLASQSHSLTLFISVPILFFSFFSF